MKNKYGWVYPFIIIAVGFIISYIFNKFIGGWAFIPLSIYYFATILIIVKPTKETLLKYFKKSEGNIGYSLMAFIPSLFCIFSFVLGVKYIKEPLLIMLWIIFAIITPFCEELFWRGYLLDNLKWKPALKILFTTIMFSISHPLMWGVFSIMNRSSIMIFPLLLMGLIWGFVYWKTKSIKYTVIAHFFVDILNCSIWVFLNIYLPPNLSNFIK